MFHFLEKPCAAIDCSERASVQTKVDDAFKVPISRVFRVGRAIPADRHRIKNVVL